MAETRKGFSFDNPDLTSNYHAPKWGLLVSPDDLRYDELYGNDLIAEANSQSITDDQLLDYSRVAIAWMERELNIDILPRLIRYENRIGGDGNEVIRPDIAADDRFLSTLKIAKQRKELYIREPGYAYRLIQARHEARIKLRRRPVRDILTAKFVDPYFGNTVIDLMPYRVVRKDYSGICFFRPKILSGRGYGFNYIWQTYLMMPYYRDMQDIFLIDYTSGYESCAHVPDDLRQIIRKTAAITLMAKFGLGKIAGIASRSVSLNSVSESISTTQSATSSYFGSTILQYQKEIKDWLKQNRSKFSRTDIGCL